MKKLLILLIAFVLASNTQTMEQSLEAQSKLSLESLPHQMLYAIFEQLVECCGNYEEIVTNLKTFKSLNSRFYKVAKNRLARIAMVSKADKLLSKYRISEHDYLHNNLMLKHDMAILFYEWLEENIGNDIKIASLAVWQLLVLGGVIKYNAVNCLKLSLKYGLDIRAAKSSLLIDVLKNKNFEMAEILIDAGIDVNYWLTHDFTQDGANCALGVAIKYNNLKLVKKLLEKGANPQAFVDYNGNYVSLGQYALYTSNLEIFQLFKPLE